LSAYYYFSAALSSLSYCPYQKKIEWVKPWSLSDPAPLFLRNIYSGIQLQRHRFMRHRFCTVIYSVVSIH